MKRVIALTIYKPVMRELQVYEKRHEPNYNSSTEVSSESVNKALENKMVQDINFGSEEIAYSRAMCDAVYGAF